MLNLQEALGLTSSCAGEKASKLSHADHKVISNPEHRPAQMCSRCGLLIMSSVPGGAEVFKDSQRKSGVSSNKSEYLAPQFMG